MRARWLVGLVASMLAAALAMPAANCATGLHDQAEVLTPSTRLDGSIAALERLGVQVVIATTPPGEEADQVLDELVDGCRGEPGGVLAVAVDPLHRSARAVGLPDGSAVATAADDIPLRVETGLALNPSAGVAQGLEGAWEQLDAPSLEVEGEQPAWAPEHTWWRTLWWRVRVGAATAAVLAVAALALLALGRWVVALRRARIAAMRARRELAVNYVDAELLLPSATFQNATDGAAALLLANPRLGWSVRACAAATEAMQQADAELQVAVEAAAHSAASPRALQGG